MWQLGVEFTNTPFHTVKPDYVLLRLRVLCQLDYISPQGSVKRPREDGMAAHFRKAVKK